MSTPEPRVTVHGVTLPSHAAQSEPSSTAEVAPGTTADAREAAPSSAAPDRDALDGLRSLHQELELAHAREARLQVDNHRLAQALETAERELTDLPTLREEAEIGRRARDAALRLQVLETSSSWKLTRPLRSLAAEARRVAERLGRP